MANNAALSSALNVDPVKRVAQLEAEKVALEGQKEAKEQERAGIIEQREARDIERETKRAGVRSRMAEVEGRPLPVSDVKYPEYKAPKETLDQLFSTLLIGAMTSTAIGKKNYMGAMQSMIGAMEGYKANRKEQIDQSIKDFDRQLKAAQAEEKMFENRIREAINKNKNDLAAMNRELELIAKEAGHDLLAARARTQPLDKTISDLAKQSESKQKAINDAYAAAQKLKDTIFQKQVLSQIAAASKEEKPLEIIKPDGTRTLIKPKFNQSGELVLPEGYKLAEKRGGKEASAKIKEGYVADNQLLSDITEIQKDLQNKELAEKLKEYEIYSFFSEEGGKAISQLMQRQLPSDVRQFLTKVRDMRNNYYLTISGKAVTGPEALRNYGVAPQPGDTPEMIADKLSGMSNRVKQAISIKQQLYGLPEIKVNPGVKTNLTLGQTYGETEQEKGTDEKGSFRWEYNADRTKRRKVYD